MVRYRMYIMYDTLHTYYILLNFAGTLLELTLVQKKEILRFILVSTVNRKPKTKNTWLCCMQQFQLPKYPIDLLIPTFHFVD